MLAKSHVNIGFLTTLLLKVPMKAGPTAALVLIFNMVPGIFRFIFLGIFLSIGILFPEKAGAFLIPLAVLVGSIILDMDDPNSTGSIMIAPTRLVLRMLLICIGGVVVWQGWGIYWAIAIGIFLILSGVLNLNFLPMERIQRILLIGAGIALISLGHSKVIIGLGVLYLLMGILAHRGLTHSLEGVAIATAGVWCLTLNIGHPELLKPFVIGYIAHYLADTVTNHGVYATYIGKVKLSMPLVNTSSIVDRSIGMVSMVLVLLICIGGMGKFTSLLNWGFSKLN